MNALDILALGIVSIGCFLVGYISGRKTDIKQAYEDVIRGIKKNTSPVGAISRPSVEKVLLWHQPEREKEEEAFKASFTKDIGDPTKL
jgi:hypothetical protein